MKGMTKACDVRFGAKGRWFFALPLGAPFLLYSAYWPAVMIIDEISKRPFLSSGISVFLIIVFTLLFFLYLFCGVALCFLDGRRVVQSIFFDDGLIFRTFWGKEVTTRGNDIVSLGMVRPVRSLNFITLLSKNKRNWKVVGGEGVCFMNGEAPGVDELFSKIRSMMKENQRLTGEGLPLSGSTQSGRRV